MPQTLASVPQSRTPQQDKCSRKRSLSGILSKCNSPNKSISSKDRQFSSSPPILEPAKRCKTFVSEDEKCSLKANLEKMNCIPNNKPNSNLTQTPKKPLSTPTVVTLNKSDAVEIQPENKQAHAVIEHSSDTALSSSKLEKCSKRMKRYSPFRIKVGCTVAVRYRSSSPIIKCDGSSSSNSSYSMLYDRKKSPYYDVWTDPLPDRDRGLALVGRRIRCIFPKSVLKQETCVDESKISKPSTCRVLEGEVISILNSELGTSDNCAKDKSNGSLDVSSNDENLTMPNVAPKTFSHCREKDNQYIDVLLLVDKVSIENMHFIKVFNQFNDAENEHISQIEKKRRKYESIIRGKDKVVVNVTLGYTTCIISKKGNRESNFIKEKVDSEKRSIAAERWIIQKRLFYKGIKLGSSVKDSNNTCYIGDGNDSFSQQEKNWRWFAGKHEHLTNIISKENIDGILFGEVLKVDVGASTNYGIPKQPFIQTLAMVTLRKLFLPEHTLSGRLPHHGDWDVYDEFSISNHSKNILVQSQPEKDVTEKGKGVETSTYLVPVEDLVVVSKKVQKVILKEPRSTGDSTNEYGHVESLYIPYSYCFVNDVFVGKDNVVDYIDNSSAGDTLCSKNRRVCHRCRQLMPESQLRQCSNENCYGDQNMDIIEISQETSNSKGGQSWWCGSCCRYFRSIGLFGMYQHSNWCGPCCYGICDCNACTIRKRQNKAMTCIMENKIRYGVIENNTHVSNGNSLQVIQRCVSCLKRSAKGLIKCEKCSQTMHEACIDWELQLAKNLRPELVLRFQKDSEEAQSTYKLEKSKKKKHKKKKKKHEKKCKTQRPKSRICFNCIVTKNEDEISLGIKNAESHESPKTFLQHIIDNVYKSGPLDFELPSDFLAVDPGICDRPISVKFTNNSSVGLSNSSSSKAKKIRSKPNSRKQTPAVKKEKHSEISTTSQSATTAVDEYSHFEPTCFRTVSYEDSKRIPKCFNDASSFAARTIELLRTAGRQNFRASDKASGVEEKSTSSRAARANQRRMLKDIASFGQQRRNLDSLSGREQSLRFGKSLIHGWGVFTDEQIGSGDMIIEYRGILIGNAVADRREKEYEKAKIGSDYMFRIDSDIVCDATHHGNLARFINASCTPNCYTQIITVNGAKRIVIYAKRDIMPGEELSYDYKFDAEFDETKRIPCNCRTSDCRGFLNWNKRFVAIK